MGLAVTALPCYMSRFIPVLALLQESLSGFVVIWSIELFDGDLACGAMRDQLKNGLHIKIVFEVFSLRCGFFTSLAFPGHFCWALPQKYHVGGTQATTCFDKQ